MGYYTHYSLGYRPLAGEDPTRPQCQHQIPSGAKYCPECGAQVGELSLSDDIRMRIEAHEYWSCILLQGERATWYEHNDDILALSREFPDFLFTLYGEGDSSDDLWVNYYVDGKCQREMADITYPEFDPGKLKEWPGEEQ